MRILHVNHALTVGGAENMILDLASHQRRAGHDVSICSLYGPGPLDPKAQALGVPVVHLRSRRSFLDQTRRLLAHLRQNPADILHSHWASWPATAASGTLTRTPRVHTYHGNESRKSAAAQRIAALFTDRVVCLIPTIDDYISRWVGVPRRKISIIPNGIDLARIDTATRIELPGIPPEAPVIGMVARLARPKDHTTLLHAAHLVNQTRPDAHFLIVGEGARLSEYEDLARSLPVRNVHFLGSRSDVPALLRRMDIHILSTESEGLPLSLLESMAAGCLPIATDIPPNRFTLDNGNAGLLVPPRDPRALADAILRGLSDPELHHRLSAAALARSRYFESERMARDYLDLYSTLLPSRS